MNIQFVTNFALKIFDCRFDEDLFNDIFRMRNSYIGNKADLMEILKYVYSLKRFIYIMLNDKKRFNVINMYNILHVWINVKCIINFISKLCFIKLLY